MTPRDAQTALAAEGCYQGVVDGLWGPQSIGAAKQFQAEQGLPQTGQMDAATLDAMGIVLHTVPGVPTVQASTIALIASWESICDGNPNTAVLEAYFDSALNATLGYGHVILDENGEPVRASIKDDPRAKLLADAAVARLYGRPWITLDEAKSLLSVDTNHRVAQMAPLLRGIPTTQAQFDAMAALAFNAGVHGFASSTVLARHKIGTLVSRTVNLQLEFTFSQQGKIDGTMEGAFVAWSFAGGEWLLGLFRRHLCEAFVYRGDNMQAAITMARSTAPMP